jgi:ABC-type uncharacterized transport system substrate-binding protein
MNSILKIKKLLVIFGLIFCTPYLNAKPLNAKPQKLSLRSIFIVESYHVEYPWDISYKEGLSESLKNNYKLTYFQMDTKRLPKDEHSKRADAAFEKFKKGNYDLVILADDAALKLVGPKLVAEKIPVVFLGINNNPRNYFEVMPTQFTGILERPLFRRSISFIKDIYPKAKTIITIWDSDITSNVSIQEIFGDKEQINVNGIDVTYKSIGDWNDWKNFITSMKDHYDVVVFGLYHTIKDETKKQIDAEEVIKWSSQNTPIPSFGFWDFSVGADKNMGGYVLYGKTQGFEAGKLVKQILEEKVSPKDIPPKYIDEGKFTFSKKQMDRWKVQLPNEIKTQSNFVN